MLVQDGSRWRKPVIYMTANDLLRHRVGDMPGIWTATSALLYLIQREDIRRIYLQGISCGHPPYNQQVGHFRMIRQRHHDLAGKVICTHPSAISDLFQCQCPDAGDIL
jgi:hypothetical protein